ncbi:MAG: hypothetical protein CMJ48_13270 [Planctomycetaceae bacterium]|nr:hypothetical protein [Planctomycetaceae bacterium]
MSLFYDLYQNAQISSARSTAGRAESKAQSASDEIRDLNARVDKLCLLSQAMWESLRDRTKMTDEDILERVHEIDARDGVVDGKMGSPGRRCPTCDRALSAKHGKCLYCGYTEDEKDHVFEG